MSRWLPYPQTHPEKSESYMDFPVLYPNPRYSGRPGSARYVLDIMCWNGEKFMYFDPGRKPLFWLRPPSITEEGNNV